MKQGDALLLDTVVAPDALVCSIDDRCSAVRSMHFTMFLRVGPKRPSC